MTLHRPVFRVGYTQCEASMCPHLHMVGCSLWSKPVSIDSISSSVRGGSCSSTISNTRPPNARSNSIHCSHSSFFLLPTALTPPPAAGHDWVLLHQATQTLVVDLMEAALVVVLGSVLLLALRPDVVEQMGVLGQFLEREGHQRSPPKKKIAVMANATPTPSRAVSRSPRKNLPTVATMTRPMASDKATRRVNPGARMTGSQATQPRNHRTKAQATGTEAFERSLASGVAAVLAKKSPAARAALIARRKMKAVRFFMMLVVSIRRQ